ncbi:hypothetical protein DFP93_102117 [Aneurinibacillus soli]|uniref:Uncharacterized protein n=1 Tax=Aneurinibacillus soli TaxID=1500254 RepID=A0A0U5C6F0_9BACL|nr:hypothetical protein DFP93_102117 [Aneurinibacillus soli]BAU27635.1 hypothetical protein CB4_01809 [Aneurinibacillus soli]
MCDIDNMDILFYFELLFYKRKEKEEPMGYIDQVI